MRRSRNSVSVSLFVTAFLMIHPLSVLADGHSEIDPSKGWIALFNGKDLANWETCHNDGREAPRDAWAVEDGVLTRKGRAYLRTTEIYGDFVLDMEFKVGPKANSGILLRHKPEYAEGAPRYWWNGLIEIQLLDCHGKAEPDKHDCGALYDMAAPSKNVMKKAGQWNRITITAKGSQITVVMNGEQIIDVDLGDWTEAGKNPDSTPNKYHKPMCEVPGDGYIWLQEHPGEVWFRNIHIRPLN
jgi:hypothetical protein